MEGVKPAEPMSSPASTAHSVTTPTVHESSTDTSPDHEGPRYVDPAERKDAQEKVEAGPQAKATEALEEGSTAEDQLLQESSKPTITTTETEPHNETAKEGTPPETNSSQAVGTTKQDLAETTKPNVAVVPDSQDGSPQDMDADTSTPQPAEQQTQKNLPYREPNVPTPTTTTPAAVTAIKEQPSQTPTVERAVTRVSSGAMRLKSVNEIVGGTLPRQSSTLDRDTLKGSHDRLTPVTSTPQSPTSKIRRAHKRDRSKGQVSTVLFGKQPRRVDEKSVVASPKESLEASDDYYTPLFVQNFTGSSNWMQPIEKILFQANKTIGTPDANLVFQDHQACKVLRRVYHLQQHDKWSLRQPKRCPEPTRPPTQWDVLLKEMKWMRTDFREERKWKMAVARNLAYACAEWHEATLDERREMQVAVVIPPKAKPAAEDVSMTDIEAHAAENENQPTPDLVSSGDADSPQAFDEPTDDFAETAAPSAIFTLQEDDVVFGLRRTTASDALLNELPLYGSPLEVPKTNITNPKYDPDAHWRRSALPLSKYVEGEMKVITQKPPRKRSRFDYENEESDDERDNAFVAANHATPNVPLSPSTDEVALFHPDSKHIRDRLHAGHQFRPPSEHPMPVQNFYECRGPSQWTLVEDDELRGLVREYSYNWSLISNMLSTKSRFQSGAERRTPWECFERWINLEGLPADMQKTQYFKAYNTRIEAAQRVIAQQNQMAAQQASASGGAVTPVRRRLSTPLRVERRRNQKHLTLLDAMRKLAKKRETTIQKQQHSAAQNSANKKTNDAIAQRPRKTPRDYSILRWERDQALAEKMAQYAQRQEAQRRAALQARAHGQAAQAAAAAGQPGVGGGAGAVGPTGQAAGAQGQNVNHLQGGNVPAPVARPNIPSQLAAAAAAAAAAQGRPRGVPMQAPPVNGVGVAGVQAQMNGGLPAPTQIQIQQAALQNQQRMPMPNQQPDANLMLRAQRISEQQRAQIHQAQQLPQQQLQGNAVAAAAAGQHNSPPLRNGINGINQQNFMTTAQAMMAQYSAAAVNGHSSPPANGLHMPASASAASPGQRMPTQVPAGVAAQLAALESSFRAKNPTLSPEQSRQIAQEQLTRVMMAQRQSAMNSAAGGTGQTGLANSIAATTSPHQYAALLRSQQQQQAALQQQAQQKAAQAQAQAQQRAGSQASPTPGPAAASPAQSGSQSHQRQSSGSATPGGQ